VQLCIKEQCVAARGMPSNTHHHHHHPVPPPHEKRFFQRSGLSRDVLARVWDLANSSRWAHGPSGGAVVVWQAA
jgi:hypothetical protein